MEKVLDDQLGEKPSRFPGMVIQLPSVGYSMTMPMDLTLVTRECTVGIRTLRFGSASGLVIVDGEAASDFSGRSVSLCHDGSLVAIGVFRERLEVVSVRWPCTVVQVLGNSAWTQIGADINGLPTRRLVSVHGGIPVQ